MFGDFVVVEVVALVVAGIGGNNRGFRVTARHMLLVEATTHVNVHVL